MRGHLSPPPGYTIRRRLGSENSEMWQAVEDSTGHDVTLRFLNDVPPTSLPHVYALAETLREIDHPHVMRVLGVVEGPTGPVVVMESARGGSLADILRARSTMPLGEVVTACAPVAEGLADVHQRGVIHGDLTADDVVFTLEGRPMVAGVGLMQAGVSMRPRHYTSPVAPEVEAGSAPSAPSDVYSLAILASTALTGAATRQPLRIPGAPPAALALVTSAVDVEPSRRTDAESLGNALYSLADPEPVELIASTNSVDSAAPPEPASEVAAPPAPRAARNSRSLRNSRASRNSRKNSTSSDKNRSGSSRGANQTLESGDSTINSRRGARQSGPVRAGVGATSDDHARTKRVRDRAPRAAGLSQLPKAALLRAKDRAQALSHMKVGNIDGVWVISAAAIVLLIVGAVVVGTKIFGDDSLPSAGLASPAASEGETPENLCGGPRPAPTETPPEVTDWTQEVQRLYTLRARAFEETNAELLCQVYAPTSAGLAKDVGLLQEYADAKVHTEGLSFNVVTVEVVSQEAGKVRLKVTDQQPDYQLIDDKGEVADEMKGTAEQTWEAELLAVSDDGETPSWRFS